MAKWVTIGNEYTFSTTRSAFASSTSPHPLRSGLSGFLALGGDCRHSLAVVLRLPDSEDRPIVVCGSETRHGLRQVGGREDTDDAAHGGRLRGIDRHDAGVAAVDVNELDV